jgi:hypothetical protein
MPDFVKINQLVQNLNGKADIQQKAHTGRTVISKAQFIVKKENRFKNDLQSPVWVV